MRTDTACLVLHICSNSEERSSDELRNAKPERINNVVQPRNIQPSLPNCKAKRVSKRGARSKKNVLVTKSVNRKKAKRVYQDFIKIFAYQVSFYGVGKFYKIKIPLNSNLPSKPSRPKRKQKALT